MQEVHEVAPVESVNLPTGQMSQWSLDGTSWKYPGEHELQLEDAAKENEPLLQVPQEGAAVKLNNPAAQVLQMLLPVGLK
jgi:hypothetical protein